MPASTQRMGFASASVSNRDVHGGADRYGELNSIRLPKQLRFDTDEVGIGGGEEKFILEPLSHDWSWLESLVGLVDDDFVAATEELPPSQSRPDLDVFE